MRSLSKAFVFLLLFLAAAVLYAQVDREELLRNPGPVTFYSYEGPVARIDSREQIRQIGVGLGQAIKGGASRAGETGRYFVIHSVSASDGSKLDADIFGLGPNAGVDHIRNLRSIIQGYLQAAYGYSERDAALLAEYTTIYNAVYRGDWGYFSGRYKSAVLGSLTQANAGLSVQYKEWPGKTLMLIPLGMGGLSAVDTSTISDSRVVEEMQKEDDKSVGQRQDMVDLKEREAEAAEQKAAEQRQTAQAKEEQVAAEKTQVEQQKQQAAEERRQLEEEKTAGTVTEQEAAKREEEIAKKEEEAEKKSEELGKEEEKIAEQKEEAAKQEEFAEKKAEEARQDRESIAQDQQTVIDRGDTPQGFFGAIIERQGSTLGRLVILDTSTRQEMRRSSVDTLSIRTVQFAGSKLLAIGGENRSGSAVRLVEVNSKNLEVIKWGEDDLHAGSLLWIDGSNLYAITANGDGSCNLGRFNTDLVLQAKSAITINPNATVIVQQGNLITQRANGSVALLNPMDLTEK